MCIRDRESSVQVPCVKPKGVQVNTNQGTPCCTADVCTTEWGRKCLGREHHMIYGQRSANTRAQLPPSPSIIWFVSIYDVLWHIPQTTVNLSWHCLPHEARKLASRPWKWSFQQIITTNVFYRWQYLTLHTSNDTIAHGLHLNLKLW